MTRRLLAVLGMLIACSLGVVAAASAAGSANPKTTTKKKASAPFLLGIEDNAQITGNTAAVLPDITTLMPDVFRFTIFWSQVAMTKPAQARNSDDPAYNWAPVDQVVQQMTQLNIPVLLTIRGTPKWAGGGSKGLNGPKRNLDLQSFAYAAADRYSGQHIVGTSTTPLPKVVRWEAWNEPNLASNLLPQWKAVGTRKIAGDPFCFGKSWVQTSPTIYRGILNAIYRGVHSAGTSDGVTETVAGGSTAPYGGGPCASAPGVAPLAFLRALVKKPVSLDVWSHHPYRNQRQSAKPYKGDNIDIQGMPRLYAALNKAFPGRKVLVWVTEFGAQTNPPDRFQGVSLAAQARPLKAAYTLFKKSGRVKMLVWFLVRDEDIAGRPFAQGFQTGLEYFSGKRKPSFNVFKQLAAQS
ncbi:MAG: hypothetical protein ABI317_16490 [Gaiellales bacterium]